MTALLEAMLAAVGSSSSGSSFNPFADITWASVFWAEDPSWTPPADGGAVSSWRNAGSGGANATQATEASQPTYRASFAALNNRPAIQFNGDFLSFALSPSLGSPRSVFAVVWVDRDNTTAENSIMGDEFSGRPRMGWISNQWLLSESSTTVGSGTAEFAPGAHAVTAINTAAADTMYVDKIAVASGDAGNTAAMTTPRIGAFRSGLNALNGAIAFIGFYNGELSTEQRNQLEAWARTRYGTPNTDAAAAAQRTNFGTPQLLVQESYAYTAWPYSNMWYDSARDKVCLIYNARPQHNSGTGTVYFVTINPSTLAIDTKVVVETNGAGCLGSTITANGDYIAMMGIPCSVYRSTNGGTTWTNEGEIHTAASGTFGNSQTAPVFTTSSGALLAFNGTLASNPRYILRSTNNGLTWTASSSLATDSSLEPSFAEYNGTVVCVVRPSLGGAPYTTVQNGRYYTSADDGSTWAGPYESYSMADFNNNPSQILRHADAGVYEIIYGSRMNHPSDSKPSLYQAVATGDMMKAGWWRHTRRFHIGQATLTGGDFGYPAACRRGQEVFVTWYDGVAGNTSIYIVKGTRP